MDRAVRKFAGIIPLKRLIFDYCRSSGPGGQHVNKKNTKVSLTFHLESAEWLAKETRQKMSQLYKNQINKDGFMIITSDKTRAQTSNVDDCLEKLRLFIGEAEKPDEPEPTEEELELKRHQLEQANQRRLRDKRYKSMLNNQRRNEFW